ncbi:hypothetical protein [Agreia sp.]|uniref:hypothetical protein n=1 Tax=Agreia sp. TaxID=1872416 RepID=UPI0035BC0C71
MSRLRSGGTSAEQDDGYEQGRQGQHCQPRSFARNREAGDAADEQDNGDDDPRKNFCGACVRETICCGIDVDPPGNLRDPAAQIDCYRSA